jgi:hypothetical protein
MTPNGLTAERAPITPEEPGGRSRTCGAAAVNALDTYATLRSMSELRVRLTGEHAELGEVPARDVAHLILEVERALARVASAIVGSPRGASGGRFKQSVGEAVRLRLLAVESGSVVPVLEIPDVQESDDALELDDASLGQAALAALMNAASDEDEADYTATEALLDVARKAGIGDRYDAVELKVAANGRPARLATVDGETRQRLQARVDAGPPPVRPDTVVGRLYEANFEARSAKLRIPAGGSVEVTFGEEHDDDIYSALRHDTRLVGDVVYDQKENVVRSVTLRAVESGEQMIIGLDADEFWMVRSFDDLAAIQGSTSPVNADSLYDEEATDEERDAFMAALEELA